MKYRKIFFGKDRFHFIKERFRALESRVLRRVFGRSRIQNIGENCTTNQKILSPSPPWQPHIL
jgi:hypothetical protein